MIAGESPRNPYSGCGVGGTGMLDRVCHGIYKSLTKAGQF